MQFTPYLGGSYWLNGALRKVFQRAATGVGRKVVGLIQRHQDEGFAHYEPVATVIDSHYAIMRDFIRRRIGA